ncbi:Hypothetical_protein [Hexamita inflata]|uniref:Hypothetical_protein n=1 Tax=Hexamita inflata TaxID=28002 RepID=A0AA86QKS2_9EUKA|nr:Hypothetical protein HINF_LOCUS45356 [Hexamita inflata]
MYSFVSNEHLSRQIMYQTRFISPHDVKIHAVTQKLDNAELKGNLFFGTDFYCKLRPLDHKISNQTEVKERKEPEPSSFKTKWVQIPQINKKYVNVIPPRPKSPQQIFQEIKTGQKDKILPKQIHASNSLGFGASEKLLLENLSALDLTIDSESEEEEINGQIVKNDSGKLIKVPLATYQRSDRTRRMLEVQMDEIALLQMQINKNTNQTQ